METGIVLDHPNGVRETAPVRVKFGPGKTQDMPIEWASIMLAGLLAKSPKLFGELSMQAMQEAKLCLPGVRRRGKETGPCGQMSGPSDAARGLPGRGGGRNGGSIRSAHGGEAASDGRDRPRAGP